jgi:diguanylate cyclase (GGDEF)-like protein
MKRLTHATRYLILFCVFLLAVNISLGYILIQESSASIRTQIESRMLDVANTAAAMLDGDVLKAIQAEDVNTPAYREAFRTLSYFKENIELEYIYCVRDLGNNEFVFTIDPDPESPGAFGDHIPYTDALYQASLGVPSVDKEPYEDSWGRFYSAYTPVFDSDGQVAGIVAVDFSAEWFEQQISNQIKTTLTISGISIFFAVVIIILIAAQYKKRFRFLFSEMNKVSDGIETLVHEISPSAKIEPLKEADTAHAADDIESLGNKIQALETMLSEQISFVRSQAYVDGLTGLGNRAAYEEHVERLDDAIKEGTAKFSVAIFDLNGLKEINDRYGHEKGDEAIISAASVLKQVFQNGVHYRIGGDEFLVISEGADSDMLPELDEVREEKSGVSLSGGCAVYNADADTCYRSVFNRADTAMYNAKKQYYLSHPDRRSR